MSTKITGFYNITNEEETDTHNENEGFGIQVDGNHNDFLARNQRTPHVKFIVRTKDKTITIDFSCIVESDDFNEEVINRANKEIEDWILAYFQRKYNLIIRNKRLVT